MSEENSQQTTKRFKVLEHRATITNLMADDEVRGITRFNANYEAMLKGFEPLAEVAEAVEALQATADEWRQQVDDYGRDVSKVMEVIGTLEGQNRALLARVETLEALLRDAKAANEARAAETGALTYRVNKLPDMARLLGRVDALEEKHNKLESHIIDDLEPELESQGDHLDRLEAELPALRRAVGHESQEGDEDILAGEESKE